MFAEQKFVKSFHIERIGVVFRLHDAADCLIAQPLDFGGIKNRMQDNIGEKPQPGIEVFQQNAATDIDCVAIGRGAKRAADKVDLLRDLRCRPCRGAGAEHVGGEIGQAGFVRRIECGAGADYQPHGHGRQLMIFDGYHHQAIFEGVLGYRRQFDIAGKR